MSYFNKVRNLITEKEKNEGPKMMDLEKIKRINAGFEQMALDYDIPVPYFSDLKPWQKEIMGN